MTKFILHGGATSKENDLNQEFFKQFTHSIGKGEIKILLCYFAKDKEKWQDLYDRDTKKIVDKTTKQVITTLVKTPQELIQELSNHDVLYMSGGHINILKPYLQDLQNLGNYLHDKIYIGSSLGAFIISEYYILSFDNQDHQSIQKGLALLPIQILCHWDIEKYKEAKLNLLKNNSNSPIFTIDECKYITIIN